MHSSTDIDDNIPCVIAVTSLLFVMLLDMSCFRLSITDYTDQMDGVFVRFSGNGQSS